MTVRSSGSQQLVASPHICSEGKNIGMDVETNIRFQIQRGVDWFNANRLPERRDRRSPIVDQTYAPPFVSLHRDFCGSRSTPR
jgi:hypothetical protein